MEVITHCEVCKHPMSDHYSFGCIEGDLNDHPAKWCRCRQKNLNNPDEQPREAQPNITAVNERSSLQAENERLRKALEKLMVASTDAVQDLDDLCRCAEGEFGDDSCNSERDRREMLIEVIAEAKTVLVGAETPSLLPNVPRQHNGQ